MDGLYSDNTCVQLRYTVNDMSHQYNINDMQSGPEIQQQSPAECQIQMAMPMMNVLMDRRGMRKPITVLCMIYVELVLHYLVHPQLDMCNPNVGALDYAPGISMALLCVFVWYKQIETWMMFWHQ
jgi:hypothetical protein